MAELRRLVNEEIVHRGGKPHAEQGNREVLKIIGP
jgi:hypothetical protein